MDCYRCGNRLRKTETGDDCPTCYPVTLVIRTRRPVDPAAAEILIEVQSMDATGSHPQGLPTGHRYQGLSVNPWLSKSGIRPKWLGIYLGIDFYTSNQAVNDLKKRLGKVSKLNAEVNRLIAEASYDTDTELLENVVHAIAVGTHACRVFVTNDTQWSRWSDAHWLSFSPSEAGRYARELANTIREFGEVTELARRYAIGVA